ncbi:hypothetical protein DFH06DRAFT_1091457 [Mycena polygramma]|nr:hypothetical protein DFH06DRAFT_1091457 [Mycena polygramma]
MANSPSVEFDSPALEIPTVYGWGPFFTPEMKTTPVLIHLVNAIFTYLDKQHLGTLTPEVYSRFLTTQGYTGPENTWHVNFVKGVGQSKEDTADAALKRAFDLLRIDHVLHPRPPKAPSADTVKRQLKSVVRAITPSASGGMMPLLTRKGFTAVTAINMLCDPARHWGSMAVIVRMYDLPEVRGWGELPRGVLPDEGDPHVMARVAQVQMLAKEHGQLRRATSYAKSQLDKVDAGSAVAFAKDTLGKVNAQGVVNVAGTLGGLMLIGAPITTKKRGDNGGEKVGK